MPRLVDPEKVLRARNLSESAQASVDAVGQVVDTICYLAESALDTPLERYQRFDFFDHRPSRFSCPPNQPLHFRLTQGFVDSALPVVWYYAKTNDQPIQYVVPEANSYVLTSASGAFDNAQVTLSHTGAVTDNWTITFQDATTFEVENGNGDTLPGGPFDISMDWAFLNPTNNEPYFTIPSAAWTGTFLAGETLTFSTIAADTLVQNPREYLVNYEEGIVTLTKWNRSGTRKYAVGYTAGFVDDGDCMTGVPSWLENAATTASVRYLLAVASRHNPKAKSDAEIRTRELSRFMGSILNDHQRPRYNQLHWPVYSQQTFLGFSS